MLYGDACIVANSRSEREALRASFPDACIVVPGNAFSGRLLTVVVVTPEVDTASEWFLHRIETRMTQDARIYCLSEVTRATAR